MSRTSPLPYGRYQVCGAGAGATNMEFVMVDTTNGRSWICRKGRWEPLDYDGNARPAPPSATSADEGEELGHAPAPNGESE